MTSNDFTVLEYIDYIQSVVATYERNSEEKYSDIKGDLNTLIDRIEDDDLYLGVVGSFSSGKSTFINSVIHKNLLPTDAVQGTTVVASILKKADYDDLEIAYNDGTVKRFSECAYELIEKYQIPVKNNEDNQDKQISFFRRFINWIKKVFRIQEESIEQIEVVNTDTCISLFKKIIATEEIALDVKCVTLYYKSVNIPYKIAMVDTPGTESLNKRHNEVTKNAIDNICDAIVVIIPYDEPVSEELLNYVNNNLEEHKGQCIFVVTKVELLGDWDELPQLLHVIKRRLENGLSIESACVIPMPTLVYLKSVDLEMKTTFLDNVSDSDKNELILMYEDGIKRINKILEQKRIEYIKKKIVNICERMSIKLSSNLSEVVNDYDEKNRRLQEETVVPLSIFESKVEDDIEHFTDSNRGYIRSENSFIQVQFSNIRLQMEAVINGCSDSQQLLDRIDFNGMKTLDGIQSLIGIYLSNTEVAFNTKIEELEKEFNRKYSRCGINANASKVAVKISDFFDGEFIDEYESLLQNRIDNIKLFIRSDTSGFFKKVKSLFSNPFNKHKEMALQSLLEIVDTLSKMTTDYTIKNLETRVSEAENCLHNNVMDMVENNREKIENYISKTNKAIADNSRERTSTRACIERLNQYVRKIREVG